jgi:hypothetical protein
VGGDRAGGRDPQIVALGRDMRQGSAQGAQAERLSDDEGMQHDRADRIEPLETLPADVDSEDPMMHARHFKGDMLNAAKKYQVQLFSK